MSTPQTTETSAATELHVGGMTCNNCARKVTDAARKVPGVHSLTVNVSAERASVRWNSAAERNIPALIAAITGAGYDAKEISASRRRIPPKPLALEFDSRHRRHVLLMTGEWIFNLAMTPWFQWLSFALAGAVQIYSGAQFYTGAWRQLKAGQSNMDTLVALGSTTAFGYSAWALLAGVGGHVYFMEAAAIITLISLGHWLEARVSDKASGALKSLMQLAPQTARENLNLTS